MTVGKINQLTHDQFIAPNSGWECPKCHSVYAPTVLECKKCNSAAAISTEEYLRRANKIMLNG